MILLNVNDSGIYYLYTPLVQGRKIRVCGKCKKKNIIYIKKNIALHALEAHVEDIPLHAL